MPGKDPARGARDTGRTDKGLNDHDRPGGGGRDTSSAEGGGLGRSRGGITGNSETARKNRERVGAVDPTARDGGNLNPDGTYKGSPFGKARVKPAAMTPNMIGTSPGVIAGAMIDALTSASPAGMAGMVGRAMYSGATGKPMSSGMAMDAALAMGGSLGEQDGLAGVGHDFSMDHETAVAGQADRARAETADGTNGDSASPVVDALYDDGEYSDVRLKDRRKGRSSDVSAALQMLQVA